MSVKSFLQTVHEGFLKTYTENGYEKSVNFTCGIADFTFIEIVLRYHSFILVKSLLTV